MLEGLGAGFLKRSEDKLQRQAEFPLFKLAACWTRHVETIEKMGSRLDDKTLSMFLALFSTHLQHKLGNFGALLNDIYPHMNEDVQAVMMPQPLCIALSFGMTQVVERLLEDPSIDIIAIGGRFYAPAVQVAVYCDNCEISKILLEHSADPLICYSGGISTIGWAAKRRRSKCIEMLQQYERPRFPAGGSWAPS